MSSLLEVVLKVMDGDVSKGAIKWFNDSGFVNGSTGTILTTGDIIDRMTEKSEEIKQHDLKDEVVYLIEIMAPDKEYTFD